MIKARLLAFCGIFFTETAGLILSPSQVYFERIIPFSLKAGLLTCKVAVVNAANKKRASELIKKFL
jgi:hypothetical protein